jgi:hypothetical protein
MPTGVFEMSYKLTAFAALAALMLASSPSFAISTVTVTTNSDGTPRLADPADKAASHFTGSIQTTTSQSPNSSGFGGAVSVGNRPFGATGPAPANMSPYNSTPDFARTAPTGSSLSDPTFGPNGVYTPGLHGDNPRQ